MTPMLELAMKAAPLALALCLSACGGGGVVSSTPPPPPTPTPTPPPAAVEPFPSTTPPTYYPGDEVTVSGLASFDRLADGTAKISSLDSLDVVGTPNRNNVTIGYLGPNSYSIEYNGFGGASFSPGEYRDSSALFDVFRKADPQQTYAENLELARKNVGVRLTYMTFGNYMLFETPGGTSGEAEIITFFAAGSRTPAAQMPTTGSASFTGTADGLWVDGATTRRLYGSLATLTADFAAGQLTSTLALRGHADPFGNFAAAPTTPLGTFTGTAAISGSRFSGSYGAAAGYSGVFAGGFYGPAANEYGLSFKLTGQADQNVFGVAVGKKD